MLRVWVWVGVVWVWVWVWVWVGVGVDVGEGVGVYCDKKGVLHLYRDFLFKKIDTAIAVEDYLNDVAEAS
ncbi:hypothetical protein I4U23_011034 [Adineta vaga]|nr:hypothetical protein I4U23_011034 [Adineta vaga]